MTNTERARRWFASLTPEQQRRQRKLAAARRKKRRDDDPAADRATVRAWRKANPDKVKRHRRKQTLKLYGLTPAQYAERYAEQEGRCAICDEPHDVLPVDHNHETGRVRKLLCHTCNRVLGLFKENISRFEEAARYLALEALR